MTENSDTSSETRVDVKPRSRDVTDGMQKAPSRAMLRAVGMTDDDWDKPQVAIASSWNDLTPCNMTLRKLAEHAKSGVRYLFITDEECCDESDQTAMDGGRIRDGVVCGRDPLRRRLDRVGLPDSRGLRVARGDDARRPALLDGVRRASQGIAHI